MDINIIKYYYLLEETIQSRWISYIYYYEVDRRQLQLNLGFYQIILNINKYCIKMIELQKTYFIFLLFFSVYNRIYNCNII